METQISIKVLVIFSKVSVISTKNLHVLYNLKNKWVGLYWLQYSYHTDFKALSTLKIFNVEAVIRTWYVLIRYHDNSHITLVTLSCNYGLTQRPQWIICNTISLKGDLLWTTTLMNYLPVTNACHYQNSPGYLLHVWPLRKHFCQYNPSMDF